MNKKLVSIVAVATLLSSPINTLANSVIDLPDGSHCFYTDIDYGTDAVINPFELAHWENHNFSNLQEKIEFLREHATEYAQVMNELSEEEMLNYYDALNDILESEADVYYKEYLESTIGGV